MSDWAWGALGVFYVVLMWCIVDFGRVYRWLSRRKRR